MTDWTTWLESLLSGRPALLIKAAPKTPAGQMDLFGMVGRPAKPATRAQEAPKAPESPTSAPAQDRPAPAASGGAVPHSVPHHGDWQPIPGGHHGGQRRRVGDHWEYRYPDGHGGYSSSPPKKKILIVRRDPKTGAETQVGGGAAAPKLEPAKPAPKPEPELPPEAEKPVVTVAGGPYTYGAIHRPPGFATVPKGYELGEHPDFKKFGTVTYKEPLSLHDQEHYSLVYIPTTKEQQSEVVAKIVEYSFDEYPQEWLDLFDEDPRSLIMGVGRAIDKLNIHAKREEMAPKVLEHLKRLAAASGSEPDPEPAKPSPPKPEPAAPKPAVKPLKLTVPTEKKFEDWGEHVPGSRKDLAAERAKLVSASREDLEKNPQWAQKMVTRNNLIGVWGPEQAEADKAAGLDPKTSWLKREVLRHLAQRPGDSASERDQYRTACKIVTTSLGKCQSVEDVWTFLSEWETAARGLRPHEIGSGVTGSALRTLGIPEQQSGDRQDVSTAYRAYTAVLGRRFAELAGMKLNTGRYSGHLAYYVQGYKTKARREAESGLSKITGWEWSSPEKEKKPRGEKLGIKDVNEGVVLWSRKIGSVERKGLPAVGNPADSGEFAKAVGFRAVQYGDWADASDREWHVTNAFWGLHDLASVLGVKTEELGINGRLALAFGARGKGGKKAPSAHYEPAQKVINLTKMNGSGTLAHEFGHFMDHAIFMASNPGVGKVKLATERLEGVPPHTARAIREVLDAIKFDMTADPAEREKRRKVIRERMDELHDDLRVKSKAISEAEGARSRMFTDATRRFGQVMIVVDGKSVRNPDFPEHVYADIKAKTAQADAIRVAHNAGVTEWHKLARETDELRDKPETEFYRAAKGLDDTEKRKKPYWGTDVELFARAFESYVEDELTARGGRSSYLVDGTRHSYPQSGAYIPVDHPHRAQVHAAMGRLLAVLRENDQFRKSLGSFLGG